MSSNLTFLPLIFPLPLLGSPVSSAQVRYSWWKEGTCVCAEGGRGGEGKLATRKSEKGRGKDVHGKTNFRERRRRQQEEEERIFAPRGEEKEEEEETVLYSFPSFSLFGKQWSAKKGDPDQFLQVKRGRQWLGAFPLCAFFFRARLFWSLKDPSSC